MLPRQNQVQQSKKLTMRRPKKLSCRSLHANRRKPRSRKRKIKTRLIRIKTRRKMARIRRRMTLSRSQMLATAVKLTNMCGIRRSKRSLRMLRSHQTLQPSNWTSNSESMTCTLN